MLVKDTFFSKKRTLNFRGTLLNLTEPKVMGILNITPDSFYAGSRKPSVKDAVQQAFKMIADGADIIDIGAYSSRPGAEDISENAELNRLLPVVEEIRSLQPEIRISIDTFRSRIAAKMIDECKADMINDISAGDLDPQMHEVIQSYQVPYVMMHMKGTPQTMQKLAGYKNVTAEVMMYFAVKVDHCKKSGIHDVVLDPGFGFGKTIEHNFELLNNLKNFNIFELPVLVGLSRKSMIYKTLDQTPDEALAGSIVLNTVALQNGASFLRVHDVKEAKETIKLMTKLKSHMPEGGELE